MFLPPEPHACEVAETPDLQVRFFGTFEVLVYGVPLPRLRTRKSSWLFALLILKHKHLLDRTWLAGILWPESGHSKSLKNLRNALHDLRRALGSQATRIQSPTPGTLTLNLERADVDLAVFDAAIKRGDIPSLAQAAALYRGPLLEGCDEEWVMPERQQRQQDRLDALEKLAEEEIESGDTTQALLYLRTCIGIDAFRETAQCALMSALASAGDYAGVIQAYRNFRVLLHEELQSQPSAETTRLYEQIRVRARSIGVAGSAARSAQAMGDLGMPAVISAQGKIDVEAGASYNPHNLPPPLSSFIGRDKESAEVAAALGMTRLLTLTGAGGSGKTRLALHAAAAAQAGFPDGVWLVELASLSEPAMVAQKVASVLEIREHSGTPLLGTLADTVKPKTMLLVLDNCEHVVGACAELAGVLLRACPRVHILATSRERLGIAGEQTYRVPSLSLPDIKTPYTANSICGYEAVRLFAERACLVVTDYQVCDHNAPAVASICHLLDGIPLAIELAAARVRSLSVEELQRRLADRFGVLTGGDRAALPRQQTLRALIDWSYNLLTEPERLLLQRLSVFAGGWLLEAAEKVCADVGTGDVLDLLTALVDKSVVVAELQGISVRYSLLQTVHSYAAEKLAAGSNSRAIAGRHCEYYLALVEEAEPHLTGAEQALWLARLEAEYANLLLAIEWCKSKADGADVELRITGALWRFWEARGYLCAGSAYIAAALARAGGRTAERAKALSGAGNLARDQGDYSAARAWYEQSLEIRCELEDRQGVARSLQNLGNIAYDLGDYDTMKRLHKTSLAIRREIGDRWGIAVSLCSLGVIAYEHNDADVARELYEESLSIRRELGDRAGIANSLGNLGGVLVERGDYEEARTLYQECLGINRELGDRGAISFSLNNLGTVACVQGNYAMANSLYQECLKIYTDLGDRAGIASSLNNLGDVAYHQGDYRDARKLYGESLAISTELGHKWNIANTLSNMGDVEWAEERHDAAKELYYESLVLQRDLGHKKGIVRSLEVIARPAAAAGRMTEAARLLAAGDALRSSICAVLPPNDLIQHEETRAAVLCALGEAVFADAWKFGSALSWESAVSYGLEVASSH